MVACVTVDVSVSDGIGAAFRVLRVDSLCSFANATHLEGLEVIAVVPAAAFRVSIVVSAVVAVRVGEGTIIVDAFFLVHLNRLGDGESECNQLHVVWFLNYYNYRRATAFKVDLNLSRKVSACGRHFVSLYGVLL